MAGQRIAEAWKDAKEIFKSPYTVQFLYFLSKFLFFIPMMCYGLTLASLGSLDKSILPAINVFILPATDRFLFLGYLPHEVLSSLHNVVCDLLAGIIYLYHFTIPLGLTLYCFFTRQSICFFFFCLGIMNFGCVMLQLSFPTAPPWYFDMNPNATSASFNTKGSPADLARLDELFGIHLYTKLYGSATLVFGSWPSLHVGWPMMCLLYTSFANHRWVFGFHTCWVSLAAVYLRHHFVIDVLGGMLIALIAFGSAYLLRSPIESIETGSCCGVRKAEPAVKLDMEVTNDNAPLLTAAESSCTSTNPSSAAEITSLNV